MADNLERDVAETLVQDHKTIAFPKTTVRPLRGLRAVVALCRQDGSGRNPHQADAKSTADSSRQVNRREQTPSQGKDGAAAWRRIEETLLVIWSQLRTPGDRPDKLTRRTPSERVWPGPRGSRRS